MVNDATSLAWQRTDSVLEALILEADLIKRHQPPFNVDQKDNKSWNYVVITKEPARTTGGVRSGGVFPRVHLIRGRELFQDVRPRRSHMKIGSVFGPFPYGGQLKEALKLIRRIFPYSATCRGGTGKLCFNRQLGLCPGVCSGEIRADEYAKTIRNIKDLFSGKFKGLKRRLAREMKAAAKSEDFERAENLRRQVSAPGHVRDVSLIKSESR